MSNGYYLLDEKSSMMYLITVLFVYGCYGCKFCFGVKYFEAARN